MQQILIAAAVVTSLHGISALNCWATAPVPTELSMVALSDVRGGNPYPCTENAMQWTACTTCVQIAPDEVYKCSGTPFQSDTCAPGSYSGPAPSPTCTATNVDCPNQQVRYDSLIECQQSVGGVVQGLCAIKYSTGSVAQTGGNCGSTGP